MSWLFFMDESGHDHNSMPFEARGGFALHVKHVWPFTQDWKLALKESFGDQSTELKDEIKGSKILIQKWMVSGTRSRILTDEERFKGVNRFLTQKEQKLRPTRHDFNAYGQACLLMADKVFDLLERYQAKVLVSLIPRGVCKPEGFKLDSYLRKDQVFLFERFFYLLEQEQEHGLLVMDQTETQNDKHFVKRLQDYYEKTTAGQERSRWIVPTPIFVDSKMSPGVQAADICLYCTNWGFRHPKWDFDGPKRDDIAKRYAGRLGNLQYRGSSYDGEKGYKTYGIVYVPDPYIGRTR